MRPFQAIVGAAVERLRLIDVRQTNIWLGVIRVQADRLRVQALGFRDFAGTKLHVSSNRQHLRRSRQNCDRTGGGRLRFVDLLQHQITAEQADLRRSHLRIGLHDGLIPRASFRNLSLGKELVSRGQRRQDARGRRRRSSRRHRLRRGLAGASHMDGDTRLLRVGLRAGARGVAGAILSTRGGSKTHHRKGERQDARLAGHREILPSRVARENPHIRKPRMCGAPSPGSSAKNCGRVLSGRGYGCPILVGRICRQGGPSLPQRVLNFTEPVGTLQQARGAWGRPRRLLFRRAPSNR